MARLPCLNLNLFSGLGQSTKVQGDLSFQYLAVLPAVEQHLSPEHPHKLDLSFHVFRPHLPKEGNPRNAKPGDVRRGVL